jgi:PAS domain S-box-containing protein
MAHTPASASDHQALQTSESAHLVALQEDLRQLEASLHERQRQLQEAQRIANLGTWRWDRSADITTWSEEVYRAFGLDPADPAPGYDKIRELHAPESRSRLEAAVTRALTTGESYELDIELVMLDGSIRWIIARGEVESSIDGVPTVLRGTIQDITKRKLTELALRSAHARFEKLYNSDLLGIGFPDATGAIHDCNDALLRVIGYTRDDLKAGLVRWDTLTPPEYRELDLAHIAESAARGACTPYEKEYIRKDGTRVPIVCGFARISSGDDPESIGFILDLSAQRQAERKSQEREQRFSALAESLPQLVWASAPNGDRIYTNRRYSEYTGLTPDQLLGATWIQLLHPDDIHRTDELWKHSMITGNPYLNEYRIRRHDGLYRSFLVRAIPVRNDAGEIQRWLGSATDIHDQKIAEESLRRTEKLAATGRLAASIAHEINNPLEAVTNALYLALLDTSLAPDTRTYLRMADQELARVAQVTTQTLRFHRQSVAAASVDLADIMDSAFSLFSPRFEACQIEVRREYTPGQMLFCRGDEIRQVFANFLSNALDATRAGGRLRIRIRPGCSWEATPRPGLRVTFADTGHGIPIHLHRSIFEPFVSTKDDTGTGLGLWVSDGIVQKHGGRIALRSRTSDTLHGTVFTLFFPLNDLRSLQNSVPSTGAGQPFRPV